MECHQANIHIEAVAVGDPVPDDVAAHVRSCRRCAARLALAERIETMLATRPVAAVPADFSTSVVRRLRRERWRAEQVVDFGFNLAAGIGALLIVAGIAGVAWQSGGMRLSGEMAAFLFATARAAATHAIADAQVIVIGLMLLTTAIGLWWWAEEDALG